MDDERKNQPGADADFDLESIMAEFRDFPASAAETPPAEAAEDRSQRLVLKSIDDAFDAGGDILGAGIEEPAGPPAPVEAAPAPEAETPPPPGAIGLPEPTPPLELDLRELTDGGAEAAEYAAADAAAEEPEEFRTPPPEPRPERAPISAIAAENGNKGKRGSPILGLLALAAMRREERKTAQTPPAGGGAEPAPDKAVRFYNARMRSLRTRGQIAAGLCLVLLYLSFAWYSPALPLLGALDGGVRVMSLLLLILECSVMMAGLDVFTEGFLDLFRGNMGASTLVAVSCVLSLVDAAVIAVKETADYGIPFCAVSAISLCFAIWGEYYAAKGLRAGFRVLTSSKTLYTVTGESGLAPDDVALLKSRQSVRGFVGRSLEADFGEVLYGVLTPFLLVAALVLGLLAGFVPGRAGSVVHCLSVLTAATATFSCAVCFALPFAAAARRLATSGAAVAGWSGLQDIGGAKRVVITDADVFPRGTVEISRVRVLEGAFTDKVISRAASVIAASGSGLAGPFADLIRRNGYTVSKVENFEPHDGGGMTAVVEGESVCVGSAAFMNLMGIRLPQKLATRGSVYAAINGALVGIFQMEYKPSKSVQDALVLLLHSKMEPIFAIRDFNITPAMIRDTFHMPTDDFKFPPYAERYRISGATPDRDSRVAAVLARDGMGPLVDVAEKGRRAHLSVRAAAWVSAAGSIFGLVIMALLCWAGAFDSATASNVITFMLLWLIPLVIAIVGLER